MTQARIEVDGRPYDVTVAREADGRRTVTIGGTRLTVERVEADPIDPRLIHVTLDGTPHVVRRVDLFTAEVDGTVSRFRIDGIESGAAGGTVGREGASIRPPMPGKVVALRVQVGASVEPGQVLLVLEAMKMQNEVTCPAAGVVTEVRVRPGQNVDTKDVLIVLGPPDAAPATPEATVTA